MRRAGDRANTTQRNKFRQTKIFIMNQAIVTAFAILLVMGAVVQKGDSYIRAGREMVYNNQGKPMQFADNLFDRPEVRRSSRPFKKDVVMRQKREDRALNRN
ncbi:hypothetical protein ACROYT_G043561 [Oculina patagonica]